MSLPRGTLLNLFTRARFDQRQRQLGAAADAARDTRNWGAAASLYEVYLGHPAAAADAGIWIQLGHARKEAGRFGAALDAYRRGIELDPATADSHLQLGHILKVIGDRTGAAEAYAAALQLDPALADARTELDRLGIAGIRAKAATGPAHPPKAPPAPAGDPARCGPQQAVALMLGSPLFDPAYYARASGRSGSPARLAAHYLSDGEGAGLKPSPLFDPRFYQDTYAQRTARHASALIDALLTTGHAPRYTTAARLAADVALLASSGLLPPESPATPDPRASLAAGTALHVNGPQFDEEYYARCFPEALSFQGGPVMHYLRVGRSENRVPSLGVFLHRRNSIEARFDPAFYQAQGPAGDWDGDPLTHYLLHGGRSGKDPARDFSGWFYLQNYPDLDARTTDPFVHYIEHGRHEGRIGRPDFTGMLTKGEIPFDPAKRTVLIACHEASRTGAPLLGLSVVKQLRSSRNVIVFLPRGGEIEAGFATNACLLARAGLGPEMAEQLLKHLRDAYRLEAVITNSVVVGWLAGTALAVGLPSVALLHEFTEYTAPGLTAATIDAADCVVVPAAIIRDSVSREALISRVSLPNNLVIRPQGCLPDLPDDPDGPPDLGPAQLAALLRVPKGQSCRVVLGAGLVQIRKGVDLFVQAAAAVRQRLGTDGVRFVWVGHYDPVNDHAYAVWVDDMVRRLGLEDVVRFVPPQKNLDALFAMADVFFLPSRMDPFPNVVLDAFRAGKPVVCFENASGFAPYFHDGLAQGAAVPFCDVAAAAQAITDLLGTKATPSANRDLARSTFDFPAYAGFLLDQLDVAIERQARVDRISRQVEETGWFDPDFALGGEPVPRLPARRRAIRGYVARGLHNMTLVNPRPGFNERAYWAAHGLHEGAVGLAHAAEQGGPAGRPPSTHTCFDLENTAATRPFGQRVAIHLHLYYADLAAETRDLLEQAECRADLFITTVSEDDALEIGYAFRKYRLGTVTVIVRPNRGRDVGPLLTALHDRLRDGGYGLVGHFHGKRSLAVDPRLGETWRRFLFGTLIGSAANLQTILSLFEEDPQLGLLFAEDRHTVGWTRNKPFAEALAARLGGRVTVPAAPIFPIGTMFWARPAALSLLWALGLGDEDFDLEPIPDDGTVLHAIERMLPSFCEGAGFTWCTVHRPGLHW